MLISISQRQDKNKYGKCMDNLENSYVTYFEKFGAEIIPIPNSSKNIEFYLDGIGADGVILSGGNDINPELYGAKIRKEGGISGDGISNERDDTEKRILNAAIKSRTPVFGICRGSQFINVFFGGGITQSIKDKTGFNHVAAIHSIKITDKKAAEFLHKKETIVNSYHNQGISPSNLSRKLKAFAQSPDGLIEGIYHPKCPIAGVLWHPERPNSDKQLDKKLIRAFLGRKLFWSK